MKVECATNPCSDCVLQLFTPALVEPLSLIMAGAVSELDITEVRLSSRAQLIAELSKQDSNPLAEAVGKGHKNVPECLEIAATGLRKISRNNCHY